MPEGRVMRDKLIGYLSGLSPAAQQMLLRTLESAGDPARLDDQTRLILEAAREVVRSKAPAREERAAVPRRADPADLRRLFFEPFEPFIIEEETASRQTGRITASSIDGIWEFLTRDVAPDLFPPWLQGPEPKLLLPEAEQKREIQALREAALAEIREACEKMSATAKGHMRLTGLLGGERALLDLGDLHRIHDLRTQIALLLKELPAQVVIGEASETSAMNVIHRFLQRAPAEAAFAGAILLRRASSGVSLARIAVALGGGDTAAEIRKSNAAVFLDLYFTEVERVVIRFDRARKRHDDIADMERELGLFHELVRGLSIAIDFDGDREWRKRLGDLRRRMSEMVQPEIDGIVATIRRALRIEGGASRAARENDAQDAIRAMTVLAQARKCRDSLAINEAIGRVMQSAEQAVEVLGNRCIDQIRKTGGDAQAEAIAAADVMLKLAEIAFGAEYASVMRKARDRAIGRSGPFSVAG
ncbi:hypothetical protein [Methylobrevis pamukkalensis]|nr:hypothetical protein [Methylobrevis pamukkalensis]